LKIPLSITISEKKRRKKVFGCPIAVLVDGVKVKIRQSVNMEIFKD